MTNREQRDLATDLRRLALLISNKADTQKHKVAEKMFKAAHVISHNAWPWQSIETAPKDGRDILAYVFNGMEDFYKVVYWDEEGYEGHKTLPWRDEYCGYTPRFFTHWRALDTPHTPK